MKRQRVAVVFGGRSGEHEISLMSAKSIIHALDPQKYEVIPIAISREGRWMRPYNALEYLRRDALGELQEKIESQAYPAVVLDDQGGGLRDVDVIFPVLHGPFGEDGTVQGFFELAGIAYVGAGVASSAVSMDKTLMKRLFAHAGLPITPWQCHRRRDWEEQPQKVIETILSGPGLPCFVKPAALGSSVGINRADTRTQLAAALTAAAAYGRKIMVEAAVTPAREIEVSVLGNEDPEASLPGEIIPGAEFYDYQTKYFDDRSRLLVPADLSAEQITTVQRLAVAAFRAVDCAGMARVDFFLNGHGSFLVNELNTIPGFTRISMYPKLWEASGLPFRKLLDRLIELAKERHADRSRDKLTPQ